MLVKKKRRERSRSSRSTVTPLVPSPAPPYGPAGGDLGGSYPNPTVVGLTHATFPSPLAVSITGSPGNGTVSPEKIAPDLQLLAVGNFPPDMSKTKVWMDTSFQQLKFWNGEAWLVVATV